MVWFIILNIALAARDVEKGRIFALPSPFFRDKSDKLLPIEISLSYNRFGVASVTRRTREIFFSSNVLTAGAEGKEIRLNILRFWLGLYAFVGTQLGWTLRPFFGSSGKVFELFRNRGSNFYLSIWDSIRTIGGF